MVGRYYSEGARLAAKKLAQPGAKARLEKRLLGARGKPLARGVLSRVLTGERKIGISLAAQLHDLLQIEPGLWARPARGAGRRRPDSSSESLAADSPQ